MPPRRFSRYSFCNAVKVTAIDGSEVLMLNDRKRFLYRQKPDNIQHTVSEGDTLWHLAARFYAGFSNGDPSWSPALLWWVIADYQPVPIIDPTIKLVPGSTIVAPSILTLKDEIFSPARRNE